MAKRTVLYKVCLGFYPLAFAAFVVGFGSPVWITVPPSGNEGLWQSCQDVFKNCTALDFNKFGVTLTQDWMVGVRAVEIFALVMLAIAAAEIAYENCINNFGGRKLVERIAPGILCVLGGLGGLSGIVVYTIKINDYVKAGLFDYRWAMMLVSAGSGLAALVGVGFCASGMCLEHPDDEDKTHLNPYGNAPNLPQNEGAYEMTPYTNKVMTEMHSSPSFAGRPSDDPALGYAMYNGLSNNHPGQRTSLSPLDTSTVLPYYSSSRGFPRELKSQQYYSVSDDRILDPTFDLSEGYLPSRPRSYAARPQNSLYIVGQNGNPPYGSRDHVYPAKMAESHPREENPSFYRGSRGGYEGPAKITGLRADERPQPRDEEDYDRGYSDGYMAGRDSALRSARF